MWQAQIREAECIGCTKCLSACPVDAIIGSDKLMHTVLIDECIGCKLCLPPCPVDCIDWVEIAAPKPKAARALLAKTRIKRRSERLKRQAKQQITQQERAQSVDKKALLTQLMSSHAPKTN